MSRILAIELENFQSIKEAVRIEFAPLTLLFGPNSAGKSAIFDALELIEYLWDPTKSNKNQANEMILRWARKEEGKFLPMRLVVEFAYNIRENESTDIWYDDKNWTCNKIRNEFGSLFFNDDTFDDHPERAQDFEHVTIRLEIKIALLFKDRNKVKDGDECIPVIQFLKIDSTNTNILEYGSNDSDDEEKEVNYHQTLPLRSYGIPATITKNTVFNGNALLETENLPRADLDTEAYKCQIYIPNLELFSITKIDLLRGDSSYVSIFTENFSDIIFYFGTVIGKTFRNSTPIVKADRRVPSPAEALFVVDFELDGWWNTTGIHAATSPAKLLRNQVTSRDPHYALMANSAHASLLLKTANSDFWGDSHAAKYLSELSERASIISIINEHLSENLFKEKLYKIECESTLMVPIDLSEDDPWSYYALAQPAAVRLLLKDGEGRKLDLHDVGSGIPFVLPVLYASVSGELARLQQPELHLHPALQSELADVFISEVNKKIDKTFIIETHSEHLLLRLLRRIRDSEKNLPTSSYLPLTTSDISIYYFDPQISGGTVVSRQLVTPLGDFYNDWPRGFFSDRDGDLLNA
jgi:AAA15 family ATPase/GTPase